MADSATDPPLEYLPPEDAYTAIARPVCALIVRTDSGREIAKATGFIVKAGEDHFLVTNWHVVTGRDFLTGNLTSVPWTIEASLPVVRMVIMYGGLWRYWEGWSRPHEISLYNEDHTPRWLECKVNSGDDIPMMDVAVVPIDWSPDALPGTHYLDFIPISDVYPSVVAPPDQVQIVGFPFGLSVMGSDGPAIPFCKTGFIASSRWLRNDLFGAYFVDATTGPAMSGAPVFKFFGDDGYKLVGVYSGRLRPEEAELAVVWSCDSINEMIGPFKADLET